ncbi:MAG: hypothetical protein ACYTF8_16935, partial [Planctomycetota bacterium]
EPHIFFSAQHGDTKIGANGIGRCGVFDDNWHKDTMELKPGASITIHEWLAPAHALFRFEKDGAGPMGDIPAFEVVSQPVEIEVAG